MARKPLRATPTQGMPIPLDEALRNGDDNFIELYAAGPGGGSGDVTGPAGAVDGTPTVFDGATGKTIKNVTFAAFKTSLGITAISSLAVTLAAGQTDDYSPATLSDHGILSITSDVAGSLLSGIAAQSADFILSIVNKGAGTLTILNESSGSSAANRFSLPDDLLLPAKGALQIWYDSASSRWMLLN